MRKRYVTVDGEQHQCYCQPGRKDEPCLWHMTLIERMINRTLPVGMYSGDELELKFIIGFELFNTRPYHNYETWSQGWNVRGHGITASHEYLEAAVRQWCNLFNKAKEGEEIPIWRTYDTESFRLGKRVKITNDAGWQDKVVFQKDLTSP